MSIDATLPDLTSMNAIVEQKSMCLHHDDSDDEICWRNGSNTVGLTRDNQAADIHEYQEWVFTFVNFLTYHNVNDIG